MKVLVVQMHASLYTSLFLLGLSLFSLMSESHGYGQNRTDPGFRAHLTERGLNYVNTVEINALGGKLRGHTIPDFHGHDGKVSYDITGIHITSLSLPSSGITTHAGSSLTWSLSGGNCAYHLDWHYRYKKGWIKVSDHGSADVSMSGVSFSLTAGFGLDGAQHPTVHVQSCSSHIGDVSVKIHGKMSWLYNLFRKNIEHLVRNDLDKILCREATNAVNGNFANAFKKLKLSVPMMKYFVLDYGLTSAPLTTPQFLEADLKGEVFWQGSHAHPPTNPPPVPPTSGSAKMAYLWMTDFVANSLAYQAHSHGLLHYNITKEDLPDEARKYLNTTCPHDMCIGMYVPPVAKQYPDCDVVLDMKSDRAPFMTVENGTINVDFGGEISFLAQDRKSHSLSEMFVLSVSMKAVLSAQLQNRHVTGKIESTKYNPSIKHSNIGDFSLGSLKFFIRLIDINFIRTKLNEVFAKGVELPDTGKVVLVNTELHLVERALMIATDLKYTP